MRLDSFLKHLLNFVFPRGCPLCRSDVPADYPWVICPECFGRISSWKGLACETCGLPLPDGGSHCHVCRRRKRAFWTARSAGVYDGVLKDALRQLKYRGRASIARPLGHFLAEYWKGMREECPVDAVAAVPLHFWRMRRRGYNQAELLARAFCRETGLPWAGRCLVRKRITRSQTELDLEKRFANVEGAFIVRKTERVKGKTILLIDDVCTTGATLEACAAALKDAGAKSVHGLTAARQV